MGSRRRFPVSFELASFVIAACAGILLPSVNAQTTTVVCQKQYDWMNNAQDQNPCLLTAYLSLPCSPGGWGVQPLGDGRPYVPPSNSSASNCRCNTVLYSVLSACAICQGRPDGMVDWPTWIKNCKPEDVLVNDYAQAIPSNTSIPTWAYLNLTEDGRFDEKAASALAAQPASTRSSQPPSTSTRTGPSHSTTASPTTAPPSENRHSVVGPAVGGVLGGLLGLSAIAGLVCFSRRRRRRTNTNTAAPVLPRGDARPTFADDGGSKSAHPEYRPYRESEKAVSVPLLYNPDDPRTYPTYDAGGRDVTQEASRLSPAPFTGVVHPGPVNYAGRPEIG